jgi:hypothetical protein
MFTYYRTLGFHNVREVKIDAAIIMDTVKYWAWAAFGGAAAAGAGATGSSNTLQVASVLKVNS